MSEKRQIIVLANSWRDHGHCIAGICSQTKEWIRPVSQQNSEAIAREEVEHIKLLDIVNVTLAGKKEDPYQGENYFIDDSASDNWSVVDKANLQEIEGFCDNNDTTIFYSKAKTAHVSHLPGSKKSLTLIKAPVRFIKCQNEQGKNKWCGHFFDGYGNPLELTVTDIVANEQLLGDEKPKESTCYLTLSLAKPHPDWENQEFFTKLIAGVIWL